MRLEEMNNERTLVKIAYHRNGVSGTGFHTIIFDWCSFTGMQGSVVRRMQAVVFPGNGDCAVFEIAETAKGNIEFGHGNSWRGDYFEDDCRKWIADANYD